MKRNIYFIVFVIFIQINTSAQQWEEGTSWLYKLISNSNVELIKYEIVNTNLENNDTLFTINKSNISYYGKDWNNLSKHEDTVVDTYYLKKTNDSIYIISKDNEPVFLYALKQSSRNEKLSVVSPSNVNLFSPSLGEYIYEHIGPYKDLIPNDLSHNNEKLICFYSKNFNTIFSPIDEKFCSDIVSYQKTNDSLSNEIKFIATTKVFPNPTEDFLFVNIDEAIDDLNVSIYTLQGNLVANYHLLDERKINLKRLKKGIYIVKLNQGIKVIGTHKIIKK